MKKMIICLISAAVISTIAACSTIGGAAVGGIAGGLWGDARTGAAIGGTIGALDDMFGYY